MNFPTPFRNLGFDSHSLGRLHRDFDRMFRELAEFEPRATANGNFMPSCELAEDKTNYTVKFDMPGIKKEDVKIEVEGNLVNVSAERREEKKSEDKTSRFSEITYGSYQRSFQLPTAVDEKKANAKFENGVLTLTLPKSELGSSKRIQIS